MRSVVVPARNRSGHWLTRGNVAAPSHAEQHLADYPPRRHRGLALLVAQGHLRGMVRSRARRFLVLVMLLVLHAQQVAALTLDCMHDRAPPSGGCRHHHWAQTTDAPASAPVALLDCQRCALDASIGSHQPLPAAVAFSLTDDCAEDAPFTHPAHFYRFDPDAVLRPPIIAAR